MMNCSQLDKYSNNEGIIMILAELMKMNEVVERLPNDMEPEQAIEVLEQRLAAAKRGLGFANRMKNPVQQKKHKAAVLKNLNIIRGQLTALISQMEQFQRAERDYQWSNNHKGDQGQPEAVM